MSTPQAIELLALQAGAGRHLCPKCHGGSDQERSLSIRIDEGGGIHWRCFRAMCEYRGGPRGKSPLFGETKKEPRYFTRPIKPVNEAQGELIRTKFDIETDQIEGYSYWDDRFILGVYGPVGYNKRGVIAYSFNGKPKSLTYNEKPNEPFIHYAAVLPFGGAWRNLVIVEDWFSAEKVASTGWGVGVAIFGTHLAQQDISEIAAVAASKDATVWLALDKDAYPKTVGYIARYREQFPKGLYAWSLNKDLKYETRERITEALVNGKVDFTSNAKGQTNV